MSDREQEGGRFLSYRGRLKKKKKEWGGVRKNAGVRKYLKRKDGENEKALERKGKTGMSDWAVRFVGWLSRNIEGKVKSIWELKDVQQSVIAHSRSSRLYPVSAQS